jgi:hypothetical protein
VEPSLPIQLLSYQFVPPNGIVLVMSPAVGPPKSILIEQIHHGIQANEPSFQFFEVIGVVILIQDEWDPESHLL